MPKMPGDPDPFRHLSGRWPHQRKWTLADDYRLGKSRLVMENGVVRYEPKSKTHRLGDNLRDHSR